MSPWESRGLAALLLFSGVLMARGGLLAALALAVVSVPLALVPGIWNTLVGVAVVVFLAGLFMLLTGRALP
jgi:hydrogenase-4 membrane subunit HyfE